MENHVAIFAGVFNLPTEAHLRIAQAARDQLDPDSVLLWVRQDAMPRQRAVAAIQHRVKMSNLNVQGEGRMMVTDFRSIVGKETETARILERVRAFYNSRHLSLVMGADRLASFHHEPNYEKILSAHSVIVVPRNGSTSVALQSPAAAFLGGLRVDMPKKFEAGQGWLLQNFPEQDVSASQGCDLICQGVHPSFVKDEVARYAKQHCLYV